MNKAVFLDRDGVINRKAPEGEYIVRWDEFQILPGVMEAIRILNQSVYRVIVITNQRAVAKAKIALSDLENIHRRMREKALACNATIDAVYYCPHDIEDRCECRKPGPGMLLRASSEFDVDLRRSWMIGDSKVDIEAGQRAGCRTALIGTGLDQARMGPRADILATDLSQAVDMILRADATKVSSTSLE